MNNITIENENLIKIEVFLQVPEKNISRCYKLPLSDDMTLETIKTRVLKYLKLNHKRPEIYDFFIEHMYVKKFLITDKDDFFRIILDLVQDEKKILLMIEENLLSKALSDETKKKREKRKKMMFDPETNIVYDTFHSIIETNRPSHPIYSGKHGEVECIFCKEKNVNTELLKHLGPIYGPFKKKKKTYYLHELCAIWTPGVYLNDENGRFKNLATEIPRAKLNRCSICEKFGAGLGCFISSCKRTYHYKCAALDNEDCFLDSEKFILYCPEHRGLGEPRESNEQTDDWVEKLYCQVCKGGEDEHLLVICDSCNLAYHIYCMQIKLSAVPIEDWYCYTCLEKKNNYPESQNQNDTNSALDETSIPFEKYNQTSRSSMLLNITEQLENQNLLEEGNK